MNIELSKFEVELMDQALNAWEKEPHSERMVTAMIQSVLGKYDSVEKHKAFIEGEKLIAEKQTTKRRLQGALLRAKLLQGLAIDSEHSFDETAVTPPQEQSK